MRRVVVAQVLGRHLTLAPALILALAAGSAAAASAKVHMLVVAGLGGEPVYAEAFASHAGAAATHAEQTGAAVTVLLGDGASRAAIQEALADMAASVAANDVAVVQLIGHGSWDEEHYRFNVPGPDPTGADLAAWVAALPAQRVLILATSSSGAAIDALPTANTTLLAATRDGRERNAVLFADYWTQALASASADSDKDRRISADEAYDFAAQAVANHYQQEGRIATEHPRREGAPASVALALLPGPRGRAEITPALAALVQRSDALSVEVERLKSRKETLDEDDYFARLQELLLELARVERELQRKRGDNDE